MCIIENHYFSKLFGNQSLTQERTIWIDLSKTSVDKYLLF